MYESASPTDSFLALGLIQKFNANSYSTKTPNQFPEDLTAKYVSAITHNSWKTSTSSENILGVLLDLEKSLSRRKFSFTSPLPLQLQQNTTASLSSCCRPEWEQERVTQPQKFEVLLRPVACCFCSPLILLHCPVHRMESNPPDRHTKQGNHAGAAVHTRLSAQGTTAPCNWSWTKLAEAARIQLTWLQPFRTKQITQAVFSPLTIKREVTSGEQRLHFRNTMSLSRSRHVWEMNGVRALDNPLTPQSGGNRVDTKGVHGAGS